MSVDKYAYRPGLIFLSKYAGYVLGLWQPKFHTYEDGSREQIEPLGEADFMTGGGVSLSSSEFVPVDEEGKPITSSDVIGMENYSSMQNVRADIRGGVFNLDYAAEQKGWTQEQKEIAARKLLRIALDPNDGDITLYEAPVPTAPWPTYDKLTNYLEIAKLAESIGVLHEALVYEQYNKKREGVIKALEERIAEREAEDSLTAA